MSTKINQGYSPIAIANYFIKISNRDSFGVTLMQLLKLSYFSHGLNLAVTKSPLSNEQAEAWKFGPVFPSIYHEFKDQYGKIKKPTTNCTENSNFSEQEESIMQIIYDLYGDINGWALSDLTHQKGSPWHTTWHKNGGQNNFGTKIPDNEIEEYFKNTNKELITKYFNSPDNA